MSKSLHWADQTAERIIRQKGNKELYTLAAGITPSGVVHIGNFREIITVELVARALKKKGKQVRFIFSWDNYDVLRKIPLNLPNKEDLEKYLGMSISEVPFVNNQSYARYHEENLEKSIVKAGIYPEFIYQFKKYKAGNYSNEIKEVLKKRTEIIKILNKYRTKDLENNWYPVTLYCLSCSYNEVDILSFDNNDTILYNCNRCKSRNNEFSISKDKAVKLLWRLDWPMRWHFEQVDFEPGGKDHSSQGGSYDTACEISREIFNYEPPVYLRYDFVLIKEDQSKMSSSKGNVITLEDLLAIYEPEIIRWLFASYKNNVDFSLGFGSDVIANYEKYDRMVKRKKGQEDISEKQKIVNDVLYDFSQIKENEEKEEFFLPSFRHLTSIIQIYEGNINKIIDYYKKQTKEEINKEKITKRINCAKNWLSKYADNEFKFSVNRSKKIFEKDKISKNYLLAIEEIKSFIKEKNIKKDKELSDYIYEIIRNYEIENKQLFKILYQKLINKDKGPKLASFILSIEKDRVINLL